MAKRMLALMLAVLMLFSAVPMEVLVQAETIEPRTDLCTNSQDCTATQHSESCCVYLGCSDSHLTGCPHYIAVDSCGLCTGTVENHDENCLTLCTGLEDCGAQAHTETCLKGNASPVHAEGCKYPESAHETCKTVCDTGCSLDAAHTGDCQQSEGCATEGCELEAGHGGLHSNQEKCAAEGCELEAGHSGLHSNQEKCATEGCELETGHDGSCSNAEPETPVLSEAAQSAVNLLAALPIADSIPADLTDEQWEQEMATLETAMEAYNALNAEDMQAVNESYADLVRNALAINDALTGNFSDTYATIDYNRWGSNVTITLKDQFDYPVTGATITVTRGNNTHVVQELNDGQYAFTKSNSGGGNAYVIKVEAKGAYASVEKSIATNSNSTTMTVDIQGQYWQDFRLYYYIKEDFFPATYAGSGNAANYGPSGNDTPFMILPVDVNALRKIAETSDAVIFRPDPSNSNQWEFVPAGNTSPKDTALANTKAFWAEVLKCVSTEGITELNSTGVGKVFYGYALKKQSGNSLHIDGVLDAVLPVYIVELYDNNIFFQEFYADSIASNPNFKSMADVLDAFRVKLGLAQSDDIDWTAQADDQYTGTYIANNRKYTVTVSRINSNKDHGTTIKNGIRYYSQSSDDSYYLAKFNMTVDSGTPLHTVTYQWKVYGADGQEASLPAGASDVPPPVTGLLTDTDFAYNTSFDISSSYQDYENGVQYTFSGWTNYSNISEFAPTADATHTAITGTTVPVTADTWINGYWVAVPLEPADAHFMLKKNVIVAAGGDEAYIKDYLSEKMYISINTHADKDGDGYPYIEADYDQISTGNGHRVDVYVFNEPFELTEMQAEVPGYTLKKEVSVSGTHVQLEMVNNNPFGEGGTVKADMDAAEGNLGTITFTNTYTKNHGEDVNEYPTLELFKYAENTSEPLSGVTFTLTSKADPTKVETAETGTDGILDFGKVEAGEYYLKEVDPPAGYKLCEHHGENGYTVKVVKPETPVEELRDGEFVQVYYHTLEISGDGTCNHINMIEPLAEGTDVNTNYELRMINEPVQGTVTITKRFSGVPAEDYSGVFMQLHLHGPIARDASGTITSVGTGRTVELKADTNWQATIEDLDLGEYLLHETLYDIHGYEWLNVTYNGAAPATEYNGNKYHLITIAQGEDASASPEVSLDVVNSYREWTAGMLAVYKVTADNARTPLSGAEFTLYSDADCQNVLRTETTGDDGVVRFGGLEVPKGDSDGIAEFYLKETKAPNGYYLSETVWKVEVKLVDTAYAVKVTQSDGSEWVETAAFSPVDDMLTVTNTPVMGSLNIEKKFTGVVPEGIQEIRVQVLGQGDSDYGTYALNAAGKWTATVTNLPMGSYTVREIAYDVPGYDLVQSGSITSADVTLSDDTGLLTGTEEGPVADVVLNNEYKKDERFTERYASFTVLKVDSGNQQPLADAVFTLYQDAGNGTKGSEVVTLYTNAEGKATFSNLHGSVTFDANNVPTPHDGKYILEETTAPAGYERTETLWSVTVVEDGNGYRVVLNEQGNFFENIWDWILGSITNSTGDLQDGILTVRNTRKPATLTVKKNVEFYYAPGQQVTSENTIAYLIKSVKTAAGADLIPNDYTISADINGTKRNITLYAIDDPDTPEAESSEATIDISYQDAYTLVENIPGGAAFVLTDVADSNSDGSAEVANGTTGTVGINDLTGGIEVVFTNRYDVSQWNDHSDTLNPGEVTACLKFQKVSDEKDNPVLAGAEFTLYKVDASGDLAPVGTDTTNQETDEAVGLIHFDIHEEGTYILRETKTPGGYKTVGDKTIVITPDYEVKTIEGTTYILKKLVVTADGKELGENEKIVNEKNPGVLKITKAFTETSNQSVDTSKANIMVHLHGPIDGLQLAQKTEKGVSFKEATLTGGFDKLQRVELTGTDFTNGKVIGDLEKGTYLVHEAFASIHNYNWNDVTYGGREKVKYNGEDYVVITVEDSTAQTLAMTNSYTVWDAADFYIHKVDGAMAANDPRRNLAGVEFTLHTEDPRNTANHDCKVKGCLTDETNASGHAHFGNLAFTFDTTTHLPTDGELVEGKYCKYYYLEETGELPNYQNNDYIYTVTVSVKDEGTDVPKWIYDISIETSANRTGERFDHNTDELMVCNTPVWGSITITKDVTGGLSEKTTAEDDGVGSVSFHVTGPDGYDQYHTINWDDEKEETDGVWDLVISGLRMGNYQVAEVDANRNGYAWTMTCTKDGEQVGGISRPTDDIPVTLSTTDTDSQLDFVNNYAKQKADDIITPASLTIYKTDDHNQPLQGAEFTLYNADGSVYAYTTKDGETIDGSVTTDGEGLATIRIYGSQDGMTQENKGETTFVLKETTAPEGYQATTTEWNVTVSADGTTLRLDQLNPYTNKFETIIHWLIESLQGKDGATAGFTYDNGRLHVTNTPKETTLTVKKTVQFVLHGNLLNPQEDADTISKLKNGADALIAKEYDFATVINGVTTTYQLGDGSVKQYDKVPFNSSYSVTEHIPAGARYVMTVPAGNASGIIGKDKNGNALLQNGVVVPTVVEVVNTYNFWSYNEPEDPTDTTTDPIGTTLEACLVFRKTDGIKPLQGAVFALYKNNAQIGTNKTSDSNGIVHFDVTEAGTYELREVTAPTGYAKLEDPITVTVTEIYEAGTETENGVEMPILYNRLVAKVGEVTVNGSAPYAVSNNQLTTRLNVTKTVKFLLNGQEVTSESVMESLNLGAGNLVDDAYHFTTSIDGTVENYTLAAGATKSYSVNYGDTYTVAEIVDPNADYTMTITDNAKGTVGESALNNQGTLDDINVEVVNTYSFWSHDDHVEPGKDPIGEMLETCLVFKKVDADTRKPLSGATFGLYNGFILLEKQTTDETGMLHFHVSRGGLYTLKELSAPTGYYKAKDVEILVKESYHSGEKNGQPVLYNKLTASVDGEILDKTQPLTITNSKIVHVTYSYWENPGTGDYIMLAVGIMAISGAALAVLLLVNKKRKKSR